MSLLLLMPDKTMGPPPFLQGSIIGDGATQYGTIGNVASLRFDSSTPFSVFGWQKGAPAGQNILGKTLTSGGNHTGWNLAVNSSGFGECLLEDTVSSAGDYISKRTNAPYNDDTWHLVGYTYDGSSTAAGVKLYIDGVPIGSVTVHDALSTSILSTASATFGAYAGGASNFFQELSNVSVWNKKLSDVEVAGLVSGIGPANLRMHSAFANLITWYYPAFAGISPLDTASTMYDRVGTNNVTLVNSPSYIDDIPQLSYSATHSLAFNGTTQYVNLGNNLNFERTDTFTFNVWVNVTNAITGAAMPVSKLATTSGYELVLIPGASGWDAKIQMYNFAETEGILNTYVGINKSYGAWHMLTMTYDGSSTAAGFNLWVDTVKLTPATLLDNLAQSILNTMNLDVGRRSDTNSFYFPGNMSNLSVYNTALNSTQIGNLYNTENGAATPGNLIQDASLINWLTLEAITSNTTLDFKGVINGDTTGHAPTVSGSVP